MIEIILYITSIVVANVVTGTIPPLTFLGFIIPYGTFFIGVTFILRDFIQKKYGRRAAYKCIFISIGISTILSIFNGDILYITLASILAFLFSESLDTEIFTRLKSSFKTKVLISGTIGSFLDSTIFVIIGLSPIFTGILSWDLVINGILGQFIVKSAIQGISYLCIIFHERMS